MFKLNLTIFDLLLIVAVSSMVTAIAFVHKPRVKAFIYSFPVPFVLANLALRAPTSVTHAAGLLMLILFLNLIRWLHSKLNIVTSIAISTLMYICVGIILNAYLPKTALTFWIAAGLLAMTSIALILEFGIGATAMFDKLSYDIGVSNANYPFPGYEVEPTRFEYTDFLPAGNFGYRYQKPGTAFIFRAGAGYPEAGYLSLGIAF